MLELPSALELESLSDDELKSRIDDVIEAIKETDSIKGDESYEQRLYRALETELSRRRVTAKTKTSKIEAGLLDDELFSD